MNLARIAVAVLIGILLSYPAQANLLNNPSFEAPAGYGLGQEGVMPPGWNVTNATPDLYSSDSSFGLAPNSANNFTGVTAQDGLGWVAGSGTFGLPYFLGETFAQQLQTPLSPGAQYTLDGYLLQARRVDLDNPGTYNILLNSTNSLTNAVIVATFDPTTNSDNWEFRSETFAAPSNAGSLPWLIFQPYSAAFGLGSYPGFDNASLNPYVPPGVAQFAVVQPTASGPPYPAQAIVANVGTQLTPTPPPILPVEQFRISLFDAALPLPPPITPVPIEMSATTSVDTAALDLAFRLQPQPPPIMPAESFFDVFIELEAHPDSGVAPILVPSPPPIVPPNPVNEFDVAFDVIVGGVGVMEHQAHYEINAGQPLLFDNIVVGPPQSPAFHVTFDLLNSGEVQTADDLFHVIITSTLSEDPIPGDLNDDAWVDIFDVGVVSDHWDDTGAPGIPGDANFSGTVDIFDVGTISDNWLPNMGGSSVPEPSSVILAALGLFIGMAVRVGRRKNAISLRVSRS